MDEIKFAYKGEARLMRWADSGGAGRTITLQLDEEGDVHPFKHLSWGAEHGQRMKIACVLIDDHEQPVAPEQAGRRKKKASGRVAQVDEQRSSNAQDAGSSPAAPAKILFRERPYSQQAALKCANREFQGWLGVDIDPASPDFIPAEHATAVADAALKIKLGIQSKTELDRDASAGARWDSLLTDFELRGYAR